MHRYRTRCLLTLYVMGLGWVLSGCGDMNETYPADDVEVMQDELRNTYTPSSQRDGRWSGNQLGTCANTTIGSAGCAITSTTMALSSRGGRINPGQLNTWLKNNGGYSQGCLVVWSKVADFDGAGGLRYLGADSLRSVSYLKQQVDQGKLVIAKSRRYTQHWGYIIGYDGAGTSLNQFKYQDPWDLPGSAPRSLGDG